MKKSLFLLLLAGLPFTMMAQPGEEKATDTSWKKMYRATATRINDLVHTKLDVRFDYDKAWLYGKEWLTLKPHFYPTDSLTLDAKGMDVKEVAMMNGASRSPLKFVNDGWQLHIKLGRTYKGGENYTIYIDYTSKPNEVKVKGSAAINDAKGLYFINPKGEEKDKPTQIWTQGETEANSVWMPTIDKPNQKTTDEIYMTVPAKYVTLSNGLLISQKKNADGTRTDYWKMDLPHSPYLFFMGVGDFAVIKDSYKGKEVSYYVEKDQAKYARGVFGTTPEMIKFYSDKLGVDYPWQKYSQIVGRDYVSGAMENTTATLHQENAYQNFRQLADENTWETVICHELFHQWFGDYVTTESWSNITVNESMADYSQTLWMEYKHGRDAGDRENFNGMQQYLGDPNSATKNLVRFYYKDKEDVFDLVSYQKGGRVLHMLRTYVGDEAFFKALNLYLTTNKFKNGESDQMRLAFEEVTGKDLNWYWNQWYFGSGHPTVKINYDYDDGAGKATVTIEQTQKGDKVFKLPINVDVYNGANKKRYQVWMEDRKQSFTFDYTQHPDLINVDADKVILWSKTDNKTDANYVHQQKYAPTYMDRKEAIDYFAKKNMKEVANGLKDKFSHLRKYAAQAIVNSKISGDADILKAVETALSTEKDRIAKSAELDVLVKSGDAKYADIFKKNLSDSSYSVSASALQGLAALEPTNAYAMAKKYAADAKGDLTDVINGIMIEQGTEADFDLVAESYNNAPLSQTKLQTTATFCEYLAKMSNMTQIRKGIDYVIRFRNQIPEQFRGFTDGPIKEALDKVSKAKGKEVEDYIKSEWK